MTEVNQRKEYEKFLSTMTKEEYRDYIKTKYYGIEDTVTENTRITAVSGGKREDHLYTWERIYHFSCGNCRNWWSYATTEDSYKWKSRKMTCPHCGHYTNIQPNPDMNMEKNNEEIIDEQVKESQARKTKKSKGLAPKKKKKARKQGNMK